MQTLVIYHAKCMDGLGALWAAVNKLGMFIETHAASYGSQPPDVTGKTVYILDFSYPRDTIIKMQSQAAYLYVVDHHISAEEDLRGLPNTVFDKTKSGAVLAWHFFFGSDVEPPLLLRYIQDRDLWQWKLSLSQAINEAIRYYADLDYTFSQSMQVLDSINAILAKSNGDIVHFEDMRSLVDKGMMLLDVKAKRVANVTQKPFMFQVRNKVGVIFTNEMQSIGYIPATFAESDIASEVGSKLAEMSQYGVGCVILPMGSNGKYGLSFRSVKGNNNALILAKAFGGGGHAQAAGAGVAPDVLATLLTDSKLMV